MQVTYRTWFAWLGLSALMMLALLAYSPGMSGGFLFDDFVNLDALGATGPVDNWPTFWRYITSGTADPTGRPLALLSFLIDANDWPADPAGFLRTNILLHLFNGALLFFLLRAMGRALDPRDVRNDAVAMLAAGMWLLHPLLVSTTLYIVQREAMLPATFTLLGLWAYVEGRQRFAASGGARGLLCMVSGIGLGTALALLSKGNGILLPLLAWVIEATVLRGQRTDLELPAAVTLRRLRLALLILPSIGLFGYLLSFLPSLGTDLPNRPWTIAQRLLTEPRVVVDYLQLLIVPRSISTGLYNEAYTPSLDLWHPGSTLPSLMLILGLLFAGFKLRTRAPRAAAAALFFFAGHVLESTFIPLELYFEHRNYVPALLFFWPLSHALFRWKIRPAIPLLVSAGILGLLALTTYQRATLWGQPRQLAALWALQNPESSRAQAAAGIALTGAGEHQRAAEHLGPLWRGKPDDIQVALNYIDATCQWRGISEVDKQALAQTLSRSATGALLIHQWLARSIDLAASGGCPGLGLADVQAWVAASAVNPEISPASTHDQTIEPLLAQLAVARGEPDVALGHFNKALAAFATPDSAARHTSTLARAGYFRQALAHLDYYETIKPSAPASGRGMSWLHAHVLVWQGYWPNEMRILRSKLADEIEVQEATAK